MQLGTCTNSVDFEVRILSETECTYPGAADQLAVYCRTPSSLIVTKIILIIVIIYAIQDVRMEYFLHNNKQTSCSSTSCVNVDTKYFQISL